MIKNIYFLIPILILFFHTNVYAGSVSITEIMYDIEGSDSGREWIEIYNNTGSAVDLTKYKFLENNTLHAISHIEGNLALPSGSYAIIADNPANFLADNPSFSKAHLYDSSFSLSNSGEALAIKDADGNTTFEINYNVSLGAMGDGKSLQLNKSSTWVSALPTLGSGDAGIVSEESNQDNNIETPTSTKNDFVPYQKNPEMLISFDVPKTAIAGSKIEAVATLFGYTGEKITVGKFTWNFGDGQTQVLDYNQPVDHIYAFPGTYTISLSFRYNSYLKPVKVGRTSIKIIESPITIAEFYNQPFPAVKVKNIKDTEYDISGYIINTGQSMVTIPEGTYIAPKEEIVITLPQANYEKSKISLIQPSGYLGSYSNVVVKESVPLPVKTELLSASLPLSLQDDFTYAEPDTLPIIDLDKEEPVESSSQRMVILIVLGLSMAIGSGGIYFLNKRKFNHLNADDYALQDE